MSEKLDAIATNAGGSINMQQGPPVHPYSHSAPLSGVPRGVPRSGEGFQDPLCSQLAGAAKKPQCSFRVIVYGMPAPAGSKRFVGTSKSGRGILIESSKKVRPWRQDVVAAALAIRHGKPLDGPLIVRMVFTLPKPVSAPKRRRTWPDKKPDVSKLARSTEDALVTAGLIADDARIVEYERLAKVFPGEDRDALESSGVVIEVRAVT